MTAHADIHGLWKHFKTELLDTYMVFYVTFQCPLTVFVWSFDCWLTFGTGIWSVTINMLWNSLHFTKTFSKQAMAYFVSLLNILWFWIIFRDIFSLDISLLWLLKWLRASTQNCHIFCNYAKMKETVASMLISFLQFE